MRLAGHIAPPRNSEADLAIRALGIGEVVPLDANGNRITPSNPTRVAWGGGRAFISPALFVSRDA